MASRASTQEFIEIVGVTDGVVQLKDGSLTLVVKTTGVNFELLSLDEKKAAIAGFSNLLNSLSFPIQIVVASLKKDIGPYLSLIDKEQEKQTRPQLQEEIKKYRSFIESLSKGNSVLEKNFYIATYCTKQDISLKRDQILSQVGRLGLRGNPLTKDELITLFHGIFNPSAPLPPTDYKTDVRDILSPQLVEVDFSFIKIDDSFYKTLYVLDYPRYVSSNWLSPLISFDHTMYIGFSIFPSESGDVLGDLKRKIAEMEATIGSELEQGRDEDPKLRAALSDALLLQEELARGTERLFQFGFYITIPAEGKEELERVTKLVQSTLSSLLITAKPTTLQMEAGFKSTIPLGSDRLLLTRNMDTTSLASTFPFTTASLSDNKGILYGKNVHDESLIIFDRFSLENANSVVFGKSGGGKSYLIKLEILRSLLFGGEIIVIDPENEYEKLAGAVGGAFLSFSGGTAFKINPFELAGVATPSDDDENELGAKITSLHGLMKVILGEMSPLESAVLDRALVATYQKAGITIDSTTQNRPPPIMEDLYNVLNSMTDSHEAKIIASRLERFIKGSLAGIFNQRSNVDIKNPFTVFSIRDIEEEIRPIAMYIILDYIWTKIRRELKKRILVIDEAWYLMKHEDSASFLHGIAKRARKYYLGLTTITQDVEDFLRSGWGKPILSNSSIQILLKQSPASIDIVTNTFYLSEGEKLFLLSANVGEGLFFAGQNHVGIKVISAPFEHEVITSSPQEALKTEVANATGYQQAPR